MDSRRAHHELTLVERANYLNKLLTKFVEMFLHHEEACKSHVQVIGDSCPRKIVVLNRVAFAEEFSTEDLDRINLVIGERNERIRIIKDLYVLYVSDEEYGAEERLDERLSHLKVDEIITNLITGKIVLRYEFSEEDQREQVN